MFVSGQPRLHKEFQASLGNSIRSCFKATTNIMLIKDGQGLSFDRNNRYKSERFADHRARGRMAETPR